MLDRESSGLTRTLDASLLCVLFVVVFLLACFPNQDMDIWFHLKAGRAILQGNGVPTCDTDTSAGAGNEWIDLHWLFQTAAAWLFERGGMKALTLATATMAVLAVAAGVLGGTSRSIAPFIAILWLPALLVMSSRFFVRPEMATLACLAAYLWILRRAETRPAALWLLVPIQIFWVNVQGLFCFGPFLLGCWLIDLWWQTRVEQPFRFRLDTAAPSAAVLLACFANPYGWRGAVFPLSLAKTMFVDGPYYREHIGELASPLSVWQATAYRDVYVWAAALLFAMTACSFLTAGVRIRLFRVLIFAVFSGLGLTAVRNLIQFALIAVWVLTRNLAERPSQDHDARRYGFAVRILSLIALVGLGYSIATGSFYTWIGSSRTLALHEYPHWHAHEAAQFVARDGMPEDILAYHAGQAALVEFYKRDQQRVFADPRMEVMQRPVMDRYYGLAEAIANAEDNWQRRINSPTAILIDHTSHFQLEVTLLADPEWTCSLFGPVAAVYVPKAAVAAVRDPSGDLARRHFGGPSVEKGNPEIDVRRLRGGLNSDLMQASALLNIARAAGSRPTDKGADRRLLLLLATRLARGAIPDLPHAACRIAAGAAFQMYGVPTASPGDWQLLEFVGAARARFLLRRCEELQPGDFASLAEEYAVATALADADAVYILAQQLAASTPHSAQHVRMRALVKQHLNSPHIRVALGSADGFDAATDVDQHIRELFESRRFQRIKATFAAESSGASAASQLSESSRDLVAKACLLCGNPHFARTIWQEASGGEEDAHTSTCIGLTYLAEQDHPQALRCFEQAVRIEPSNAEAHCALALCHLELGSASTAVDECSLALDSPEIAKGLQPFCERMRDFATRFRSSDD